MKRFLTLLLLILATMPFGLHSQQSVTVNSTGYSSYSIPISGERANNYQKCHFVLPAENLTTIDGKLIYSLSFYSGYSSRTWTNGSFSVYLDEVNYTEMSDFADVSTTTRVYTGELSVVNSYMTVNFETPYVYQGGNLLVCFEQTVTTNNNYSTYFYCSRITGKYPCVYGYDSNSLGDVSATQSQYTPYTILYYADSTIGNIYVKEGGSGDKSGFSWDNASDNLDNAVALTKYYGKRPVWVAAGTYYGSGNSQNDVVTLLDGVNMYGGFAGNEPENYDLSQRDFTNHETILDGQNSQRVVKQLSHFTDTTYFDGFTVQNGYKTSSYSPYTGGGMSLKGKVYVRNCVVKNNYCSYSNGGGIYIDAAEDCRAVVENCEISGNSTGTSYNRYGGGIYCNYAILKNNTVTGNTSRLSGGGIYAINSTITNCVVNNNTQSYNSQGGTGGGGMYVENSTVSNCTMHGNTGRFGGGIFGTASTITDCEITDNIGYYGAGGGWFRTNTTVTNCIFTGNHTTDTSSNSSDYCGAMIVYSGSVISSCVITNNSGYSVGGVELDNSTIDNCLIANNTGEGYVGGIYMVGNATVINCDVVRNLGGGLKGSGSIKNTIVWGNERNSAVYNIEGESITATNCAIQGGYSGNGCLMLSNDNTGSDYNHPRFANPSTTAGVEVTPGTWSWQLTDGSICVNRGTTEGITPPAKDLAGNDRTQQGAIDMGCYESAFTAITLPWTDNIVYVTTTGAGDKSGTSWSNACDDINTAIYKARAYNIANVWVAKGTYTGDGVSGNNAFTLYDGVNVYGSLNGDEASDYNMAGRNLTANATILSGQDIQRVVYQNSNFRNVTYFDGFIVQNGKVSNAAAPGMYLKGKIYVRNCVVKNNQKTGYNTNNGGGVYVEATSDCPSVMVDCEIKDNTMVSGNSNNGGGLYCKYTTLRRVTVSGHNQGSYGALYAVNSTVKSCTVTRNNGGLYAEASVIDSCTVTYNKYDTYDGTAGVYLTNASTLTNSTVSRNQNTYYYSWSSSNAATGGVYVNGSSSSVENCTISLNKSGYTAGVYCTGGTVKNCVITNNFGKGVYITGSSSLLENCLISNNNGYGVTPANSARIRSCDIVGNSSMGVSSTAAIVVNCLLWGNNSGGEQLPIGTSITYSGVESGYAGTGIIMLSGDNDGTGFGHPLFENPSPKCGIDTVTANISWQLQDGSVCVNRGSNDAGLNIPEKDLAGNTRTQQGVIDFGCYESPYDMSSVVIPTYPDDIVYVKQGGAGDKNGTSWANATGNLNEALGIAVTNGVHKVWVAAGKYYGDSIADHNAFTLYDGISIYGGFAGTEAKDYDLSLRDFNTNKTILDGQNVQRVVYQPGHFADTTYVDGFTITKGSRSSYSGGMYLRGRSYVRNCVITNNMMTNYYSDGGAGIYMSASSTYRSVIENCTISGNSAYGYGGGVWMEYATMKDCTVSGNTSTSYSGGGVWMQYATMNGCTVSGNTSGSSAGGVYMTNSSTLENSTITGNACYNEGGGVWAGSSSEVTNCEITRNTSRSNSSSWNSRPNYVGGLYASGVTVTGCTITMNKATNESYTGGVYATNSTFAKCVVTNNSGRDGGMFMTGSTSISNSLVSNNSGIWTGGIYVNSGTVTNCDVVRNSGYGLDGYGTAMNTIVWGNREGNMVTDVYGTNMTMTYCAVGGGYTGTGNMMLDTLNTGTGYYHPKFANPSPKAGLDSVTANISWQLTDGTVCANRGTSEGITPPDKDLAGNDRVQQGVIDMGCYESPYTVSTVPTYDEIVYVRPNGAGEKTGTSWDNATGDLNYAIGVARTKGLNKVWVAAGTYVGDGEANNNAFTIYNGISIYGGFAGTEAKDYDISLRDLNTNKTILDGQNVQRVVYGTGLTDTTFIDGFTITKGKTSGSGAGMSLSGNSYIRNCIVTNNTLNGNSKGVGLYVYGVSQTNRAVVENCVVSDNTGTDNSNNSGGGMYCYYTAIKNTDFLNNTYTGYGGGVFMEYSTYRGGTVSGNKSTSYSAGGIYASYNDTISNVTVTGNSASSNAGGVFLGYEKNYPCVMENCTITRNRCGYRGGGAYVRYCSVLKDCVITMNKSTVSDNNASDRWEFAGGVFAQGANIINCVVTNNMSYRTGGIYATHYAYYNYGYTYIPTTIDNCLISNNSGAYTIGGVNLNYGVMTNCDVVRNNGGGMTGTSGGTVKNTIVWGNEKDSEPFNVEGASLVMEHCAVTNGYDGTGNITMLADNDGFDFYYPRFEAPSNVIGVDSVTANISWQLTNRSICVNRGTTEGLTIPDKDLAGNDRVQRDTIDIGCYESPYNKFVIPSYDDNIVYVKVGGAGTGTGVSWTNATGDLNYALGIARSQGGIPVWVAAGTYVGDSIASHDAFGLYNGVSLYGGFVGNEPKDYDLSQRDINTNKTILDGQKVQRVVYQEANFTDTTYIDGFTIQNGKTTGYGGGLNLKGKSYVRNCVIKNDTAGKYGGGVYIAASSDCRAVIKDCVISNNVTTTSSSYGGGGLHCYYTIIENVDLTNNKANGTGGGVYMENSTYTNGTVSGNQSGSSYSGSGIYSYTSSTIRNVTVTGNNNSWAVYLRETSSFENGTISNNNTAGLSMGGYCNLTNTTVSGNTGDNYGGVYVHGRASTVDGCTITGNTASTNSYDVAYSAGLRIEGGEEGSTYNTVVKNTVIKNNSGNNNGGAYVSGNYTRMENCLVANNTGGSTGGVYINYSGKVISCDIVRNAGGGVSNNGSGTMINTIVWGNDINMKNVSGLTAKNCAVTGGCNGSDNIALFDSNTVGTMCPCFVAPSYTIGVENTGLPWSWQLAEGSICVNRGTSDGIVVPENDLAGNDRVQQEVMDIGCYESAHGITPLPTYGDGIVYVTNTGAGSNDGSSWDNALSDINMAASIAKIYDNVKVWVAKGTYTGANRSYVLTLLDGVDMYGGFAGNEPADYDLTQRDFETNTTILDGQNERRVVGQEAAFTDTTRFDGFTVRNGYSRDGGGGMRLLNKSHVRNCVITGNRGYNTSGGVYVSGGLVEKCVITSNVISNNPYYYYSSGIWAVSSIVRHCVISQNRNDCSYTAIVTLDNSLLDNCLLSNNSAISNGSAVYMQNSSSVINCDIVNNVGNGVRGYNNNSGDGSVVNTIIWGNSLSQVYSPNLNVTYCAVTGGFTGTGNINLNADNFGSDPEAFYPCFLNPTTVTGYNVPAGNWSWQLTPTSACKETGTTSGITVIAKDLAGTQRVIDDIDMGCYEFNSYLIENSVYEQICEGESYSGYGFVVEEPAVGNKTYTNVGTSYLGLDSIMHLNLTVNPKYLIEEERFVCDSLSIRWHGKTITDNGTYYDSLTSSHSCDSVYMFTVEFLRQPVGDFTMMIPADNATVKTMPLTLAWATVTGATSYDIYLWEENETEPGEPYVQGLANSYVNVSSVLNGHTYHWYVIARNACHETTSSVMTFTLDITPSLALSNHDIEFGEVTLNQTASRSVAVSTYYPMDVITMNIEGDDAAMFSYSTTTGWNDMNGGIMVVSFNPTTPKFNYDASVIVNCGDLADTISLSGGVANLFTFDTNVDGDVFAMGSTIPITGSVTDWTGGPAANIEVEVGVTVMNTKRTVMTETDANGHFSTTFELTPNESGYYTVNSGRAGYTGNAVHDEFNIPGIALVNNDFKYCLIDQGYSMTDSIRIRNKSNLPLNSIQLTALTNIAGCSWSASPVSLSGLDEGYIVYTITGSELTEGNQYQELKLKATSAEGAEIQFSVWYYCKPARGNLDVWPNMLTTTMTKGQSKIVDVMLVNGGTSETGAVTVELPNENWLSLVGSNTMSSIPVNDTAYFSLRLSPGENIDLVQYTGSVVIHSERGDDKVMYYNINAVSESTGAILVDATDEYTYNTNGGNGPHLAGAYVTITNYYSLETVAQGYTDEDGLFHADSYTNKDGQRTEGLPEGYYRVKVTADQHDEFVNNISVGAGRTTRVNAFMQYQAITYSWDVQPTEIQDEYTFELVTVFETNVPKPVITIDHTGTRDLDYGETDIFNLIITNHGLITAYENSITLDQMDEYSFVPLYDFIDSIPAQTTIIVPCQYTHLEPGRGYNRSSGCYVQAHTKNYYRCGMDRQWQLFKSDYIAGHECALLGSGMLGTLSIGAGGWGPSTPIYFGDGGGGIGTVPSSTSSKPAATSNESCTPCAMTGLGLLNSVAGCIPGLSGVKQAIQCGVTGLVSAALTGYNDYHSGASAQEQLRNQGLNAVNTAECLAEAAGITVAIPVGMFNCVYGLLGSVNDAAESCYHTENAKNRFVSYDAPFNFADYYAANCGFFIRQGLLIENIRIASRMSGHFMQLFREDAWQEEENSVEFLNCILNLSRQTQEGTISDEAADNLASTFVGTSVSSSDIHGFINRWNRTIYYWNAGYHTTGDVPDGMSYDFLEYPDEVYEYAHEAQEIYKELISECQDLNPYFHLKDGEGGDDYALIDGFIEASDYIMEQGENTQSNSVCARVTVQFSQTMTMTREAFNGTFSVHNGNEVNSIKEIELNFVVKDKSTGADCTHLFQINTTSLNNITSIDGDGTLGAGLDGTALIQFIPTKNAAPTTPKVYSFGGTFAFLDPYTEENVVFDLYPVDLTVNPSPDLYVDYFMQRDILGDDAFTEDKVEPSIPAELGVRIHNKGMGMAKNVNLETAEPEIVDNEKGLAIDFAMYGASFNGNDAQIGLMNIPFGNIESGKTGVGEWLFTSSLLGHFISYSANVIHNNSFGNPELSLVSSLRIHELIHPIRVYGAKDDDINDFLVNDDDDANDIPDTIHFSHGGKTSVGVFDAITFDDYVTREDTIVTLTVDPSRIGWNYGNCEDPGQDKYELVSCTRDSDGQEIPLQNVWQTFVTLHDQADPLYENKLHIVDTLSAAKTNVTYTLVYTLKTNLLDVEEIITGIDDPSVHIEYPLTSFQVKFNEKIIDSTFTYRDMTLKCNNGDDLMNENVVITKVADSLYNVDITGLTNETGYYVLNVHTLNIKDERGYTGYNGKQATWIQYITAITQNDTLVAGWNWWSTYIEQSTISGLDSLEKTLGSNGLQIKSHLAFVDNYYPTLGYNYWYGSLTDIDNESSYRLKLVDDGVTTVKGPRSHADEHEITISPEWNWIGYPLDTKRNVNTATDGFTPEANDIMKSHNESSIYYSGYGWYPVINLEPGKGYMYKSNADVAKTLTYNVSRNEELATPDAPHLWTTNRHAFADNLTVIAAVYVDGERLADGNMELGAFVNGECRGSAILKHFPPLDCYYAVLTVSGEDGDAINFGLIDRIGGVMNFNSQENMVFEKNAVAGDIENPYEVRFSTASSSQMTFSMYPNPVEKGRTITLDIPGTETVTEVVITDILGTVIRRNTDGSRVVKGLTTRGVYDIQVFTASGNIYHGRLIVK